MGSFSIWHWLIVLAVAVVLFGGGGKLSRLMGDFGRGLREFKSSLEGETKKRGLNNKGGGKDKSADKDKDKDSDEASASTNSRAKKGASKKAGKKKA